MEASRLIRQLSAGAAAPLQNEVPLSTCFRPADPPKLSLSLSAGGVGDIHSSWHLGHTAVASVFSPVFLTARNCHALASERPQGQVRGPRPWSRERPASRARGGGGESGESGRRGARGVCDRRCLRETRCSPGDTRRRCSSACLCPVPSWQETSAPGTGRRLAKTCPS